MGKMDFEINSFGAAPPPVSNADQITYQAPMVQSLAPNQVEYSQPPPPSFTSPGDPVVVVPHGAAPGSVVRMGMGHPYGQPVRHLNRPSYYPMPTYRPSVPSHTLLTRQVAITFNNSIISNNSNGNVG